jgi:hypothetical protein
VGQLVATPWAADDLCLLGRSSVVHDDVSGFFRFWSRFRYFF